jgi:hypothetical protein
VTLAPARASSRANGAAADQDVARPGSPSPRRRRGCHQRRDDRSEHSRHLRRKNDQPRMNRCHPSQSQIPSRRSRPGRRPHESPEEVRQRRPLGSSDEPEPLPDEQGPDDGEPPDNSDRSHPVHLTSAMWAPSPTRREAISSSALLPRGASDLRSVRGTPAPCHARMH